MIKLIIILIGAVVFYWIIKAAMRGVRARNLQ